MRVLYVTHYSDMYGANYSLFNMIILLRDKYGIEPVVLLNKSGAMVRELEANHIEYLILPYLKCTVNTSGSFTCAKKIIKKLGRFILNLQILKKIIKMSNIYNIDIVHSNSSVVDIGYFVSKKLQCPHVWHIREYGKEDYNLEQIDKLGFIQKRYMEAAYIIAISNDIGRVINGIVPQARIEKIYNGIKYVEDYEKTYCVDGKIHFCVVGLISPYKNQIEVIRAIQGLCKDDIEKVCLHIVGGDYQGEKNRLIEYVSKNHLEQNVIFEGYKKNINEFLARMDVGIMPSVKEAFGRVTIEYMSNYMPVIGAASGGTKELIQQGYNGYLYESGESDKLTDCMRIFLKNPQKLVEMGKAAKKFSQQFTIEANARNIYELYQSAFKDI